MSYWLCLCVLHFLPVFLADDGSDWNYAQTNWGKAGSPCAEGRKQSPVDLKDWVKDNRLKEIEFNEEYKIAAPEMYMKHVGKTVQVLVPDVEMKISGGSLGSTFTFLQMHFHWGLNNKVGSEHTINGESYAQEFHLVHWNSGKYANPTEATKHKDGLAVLGVFVSVDEDGSKEINHELELITHYFDSIRQFDEKITVPFPFPLYNLIPKNRQFFTYPGSLTTPDCNEIVIWTVFKDPIYISNSRMLSFRKFKEREDTFLDATHRPVQPINDRRIFISPVFARKAISLASTVFPNGIDSVCKRIDKEEAKFVEVLDIKERRQEMKLEPFRLENLESVEWMLYKMEDRVGFKHSLSSPNILQLEGGNLENPHELHEAVLLYSGDELSYQSPHSFNKVNSPLEIHLLFFDKKKYESFLEAKEKKQFLIVAIPTKYSDKNITSFSPMDKALSTFIEKRQFKRSIGEEQDINLHEEMNQPFYHKHKTAAQRRSHENNRQRKLHKKSVSNSFSHLTNPEEYIDVPKISVENSFLATLMKGNASYFKYYGPTTFPHCSSRVQWVVLQDTIPLNLKSIKILREIELESPYEIVPSKKSEMVTEILYYNQKKVENTGTMSLVSWTMVMLVTLVPFLSAC